MPPRRLRQQQRSGYAQLPVFKYQTFDRNDLTFTDIPIVPPTQRPIRHYSQVADQLRQEGHPPPTSAPKSADIPHAETDGCLEATVSPLDGM